MKLFRSKKNAILLRGGKYSNTDVCDLCRCTSLLPLAWCKIYLRKDKTNVITVSVDGWLTPNLYHQNQQTRFFVKAYN